MEKIILTGDRPTGRLHIGHYIGSIKNRLKHQNLNNKCIFLIADLHTLTTNNTSSDISAIKKNVVDMVLDWLACGIDPQKSIIYLQSQIPQIYELNFILTTLLSVSRLKRIPSLKEMAKSINISEDDSMPYALLGYPVLQSADILLPFANVVPVGKDNISHIELCKEIARKFNYLYGDVFPIPEGELGGEDALVGTDNKGKMSKSLNNSILLSEDEKTLKKKINSMYTDPNRTSADVAGDTKNNPVFIYHRAFNSNLEEVEDLSQRYQKGKVGDTEVKEKLFLCINEFLSPIREKRMQLEKQKGYVENIIFDGTCKMQKIAEENMRKISDAFGVNRTWKSLRRKSQDYLKDNI